MPPSISIIIPSALRTMPHKPGFWLERALRSIRAQTVRPSEILIGLDPGEVLPERIAVLSSSDCPVRQVNGSIKGHQAACNAAASKAQGTLLAFLEDDDEWTPNHLETLLAAMDQTGALFVSTSQLEVTPEGEPICPFDYPTASGWLLTRLLWLQVGGFDTRFRVHHDNVFISEVNRRGFPRAHVIEGTADTAQRQQLHLIAKHARIIQAQGLDAPTVRRTVHEGSVLGQLEKGGGRARRSMMEYAAVEVLYGDAGDSW